KRVTARTKRELDAEVAKVKAAWATGTYLEPSKEPFGRYLEHWLETADLAPNTRKSYEGVARRRIIPMIGAVPLGKLTGRHVQEVYNAARGTSYAVQVQAVTNGALRLAVREGLIARNVAEGLTVGRVDREEPEPPAVWTPEQLNVFLDAVRDHWLFPLYWTAAYTGLRLSELIALHWDDVTLDLGYLFVGQSKTRSGRRRIALDADTVAVLTEHRREQARRQAALGPEWHDNGLVFDRGDGRPVSPRTAEAVMARYVARLGLPKATPHSLRHFHATVLLSSGVPAHVVQRRLGHASSRTTLDVYAHVLPGSEHGVAESFAQALRATKCDQIVTKARTGAPVSASG
ncbi:MAG: site-specific integrase, partial [Sphaerobacter sp.]|nr:site-specific integrase [Sphaerobacter sp.]